MTQNTLLLSLSDMHLSVLQTLDNPSLLSPLTPDALLLALTRAEQVKMGNPLLATMAEEALSEIKALYESVLPVEA